MATGRTLNARAVRRLGGLVVLQYYLTSRLYSLYGLEHQNTLGALEALGERMEAFFAEIGRFSIKAENAHVFVNEVRIRVDAGTRQAVEWLVERFHQSGLKALTLLPGLKLSELKRLIPLIGEVTWPDGAPPPALARMLRDAFVSHVKVRMRRRRDGDDDDGLTAEVSARALGAAIYARLRDTTAGLIERARIGDPLVLKSAKLLVQQASDILAESPGALLSLLRAPPARPDEDGYLASHMANACVLSLAMGVRLGLSRPQLLGLGCAGLVYDVGMVRVPLAIRQIPGPLPPEAQTFLRGHPEQSALAVLVGDDRSESAFQAAVVAARHHAGPGYPSLVSLPRSLVCDIVSCADVYDARVSRRPWRPAEEPFLALQGMLEEPRGLDPSLVRLLAAIVGVYPAGALVELNTGELGIVAGLPVGSNLSRPQVKLLLDADGRSLDGLLVSLAERDAEGRYVRAVTRVLDATALEVSLEDLVAVL